MSHPKTYPYPLPRRPSARWSLPLNELRTAIHTVSVSFTPVFSIFFSRCIPFEKSCYSPPRRTWDNKAPVRLDTHGWSWDSNRCASSSFTLPPHRYHFYFLERPPFGLSPSRQSLSGWNAIEPNFGGGNLTFLGHPIELGPAKLQVLGQIIKSEPFVSLHNHLSLTIKWRSIIGCQ